MTAKQRHRAALLRLAGRNPTCALEHRGGCRGDLEADHIIELGWLHECLARRRYKGKAVPSADTVAADARNGWLLCERHHGLKTAGLLLPPILRDELPETLTWFTDDYNCAHLLDGRGAFEQR